MSGNLHHMTDRCYDCSSPPVPGKTRCLRCSTLRRERRLTSTKCQDCGAGQTAPGRRCCFPCVEKRRIAAKRYREANPDKCREVMARWYINNRDMALTNSRAWRNKNPHKVFAARIRRDYGLTAEVYESMLEAQGGRCACCGTATPGKRGWCIDHKHVLGYNDMPPEEKRKHVRGVLCDTCNRILGHAHDDASLLERCSAYARLHG